jgi:hypothetical protein
LWCRRIASADLAIANTASVALLQEQSPQLEQHVEVKAYFRTIGDALEGSFQPFVHLRLYAQQLGKLSDPAGLCDARTFGDAVAALSKSDTIYEPPPWGIGINQWRNIALHNSYRLVGSQIECEYGPPGRRKSLSVTRDEVVALARYVDCSYFIHKVAFEIFTIDNIDLLKDQLPEVEETDFTKDARLAFGLTASGFSIVRAEQNYAYWYFDLIDTVRRDELNIKAALHEACFPYSLVAHPVGVRATVASESAIHQFSFIIYQPGDEVPPHSDPETRLVDIDYRLLPKKGSP